jgi:hypothetical protein
MRAQPDEVRDDAGKLAKEHADILRALRDLAAEQLLHRKAIRQLVVHRREVVHAAVMRDVLRPVVELGELLNAGVQVADVRHAVDDVLAVQLQRQAQYAVRRGMLRAHVKDDVACRVGASALLHPRHAFIRGVLQYVRAQRPCGLQLVRILLA